jgi:hypothetical protein
MKTQTKEKIDTFIITFNPQFFENQITKTENFQYNKDYTNNKIKKDSCSLRLCNTQYKRFRFFHHILFYFYILGAALEFELRSHAC